MYSRSLRAIEVMKRMTKNKIKKWNEIKKSNSNNYNIKNY